MSSSEEEVVDDSKYVNDGNSTGHVVKAEKMKSGRDFIEFSVDEEASDQVFITVPNLADSIDVLRANKESPQKHGHPLANAVSRSQHFGRVLERKRARKYALTRDKLVNKRYMINTKDPWTCPERNDLINALRKYGVLDIKNMCKEVPTKTEPEILEFIEAARAVTQQTLDGKTKDKDSGEDEENPIAVWLLAMEESTNERQDRLSAYNLMLPKVFLYISKYCNHPDPANCGGINYSDAYEYIYHMLSGLPGKDLTLETSRFVRKTLLHLSMCARGGNFEQVDFINSISYPLMGPVAQTSTNSAKPLMPSPKKQTSEINAQNAFQEIASIPAANPLNIPVKVLEFRNS